MKNVMLLAGALSLGAVSALAQPQFDEPELLIIPEPELETLGSFNPLILPGEGFKFTARLEDDRYGLFGFNRSAATLLKTTSTLDDDALLVQDNGFVTNNFIHYLAVGGGSPCAPIIYELRRFIYWMDSSGIEQSYQIEDTNLNSTFVSFTDVPQKQQKIGGCNTTGYETTHFNISHSREGYPASLTRRITIGQSESSFSLQLMRGDTTSFISKSFDSSQYDIGTFRMGWSDDEGPILVGADDTQLSVWSWDDPSTTPTYVINHGLVSPAKPRVAYAEKIDGVVYLIYFDSSNSSNSWIYSSDTGFGTYSNFSAPDASSIKAYLNDEGRVYLLTAGGLVTETAPGVWTMLGTETIEDGEVLSVTAEDFSNPAEPIVLLEGYKAAENEYALYYGELEDTEITRTEVIRRDYETGDLSRISGSDIGDPYGTGPVILMTDSMIDGSIVETDYYIIGSMGALSSADETWSEYH